MKLTEEQIKKAVQWWADCIIAPTFSGLSPEERRNSRNEGYELAEMFATMSVKSISDEQIEKFSAALGAELRRRESVYDLSVDYSPCVELANAAEAAGIPATNFPWKTVMTIEDDGRIKAKIGYGAEFEYI